MQTIIHIIPQIGIGGAERQLYELIRNSDSAAVTHKVFYYSDSKDIEGIRLYKEAGIFLERIPRDKNRPIKFLRMFAARIKECNPDIVQCWLFSGNIWGRWAAILAGARRIIVTYRSSSVGYAKIVKLLEQFTKNRVHYLANSRACADLVARRIGVDPKRFSVIYNGFDIGKFNCEPVDLHKECAIPPDHKIAVMVGRLTHAKNYPMLLRIVKRCKDAGLPIRFVIVGHGEKEAELKEMAQQFQLDGIVHFLGLRHDIPALLKGADVFCYTSFYEGFPNALLEAMAAGLPVIATNFAGVDELITDKQSGVIVPMNNDAEGYAAMNYLLHNPAFAKELGENSRKKAYAQFSLDAMTVNTLNFYNDLMEPPSAKL